MEKPTELGECSTQPTPVVSEEAGQNTDLVDQVFTMFKGYLTSQLEEKGHELQNQATIEKQAIELKYKGNRKQFEFNDLASGTDDEKRLKKARSKAEKCRKENS